MPTDPNPGCNAARTDGIHKLGSLSADPVTRHVWITGGPSLRLPTRRFLVLLALMDSPSGCSCSQLLISGWAGFGEKENIRLTIHRLRKDLEKLGNHDIETISSGYRMSPPCHQEERGRRNQVRKMSDWRTDFASGSDRSSYTRFQRSVGRSRSSKTRSA